MQPFELSARAAARAIAAGELGVVELVRSYLDRIETREPTVRAFAHIDPELLLEQAHGADAAGPRAPLRGVPVGIKDIIDTRDLPTEHGSPIYRGNRPDTDAACVQAIRDGGGLVLGKTVSTEFAYRHPFGDTRNPHHPAHTPGGSSSGSAAGVADRLMPIALGTQTGGSVIRPASFCGVFGYKASFALFPIDGVKPLAPSLDTLGIFARDVEDLAWLGAVLSPRIEHGPTPLVTPPRLCVARMPEWSAAEPSTVAAVDDAALALERAGGRLEARDPPARFDELSLAHTAIMEYEAYRSLEAERTAHADGLSDELRTILERAGTVPRERHAAALERARAWRADLQCLFGSAHALVTASATGEAPEGLAHTGSHVFNRVWTLLHLPCVTLPAARGPLGLPVGIQLVGRPGADNELLRVAAWATRALGASV
jgi:Asp-tRNA(Asn)/Glu-tRNA(Gln) amidotransferase A subunit family amidase